MNPKRVFAVMIDGLGYYAIREEQMPFLTDLLKKDKHKVRTPLGYSGPILGSLFTGCTPRVHGVWNTIFRKPGASSYEFIKYLPWLIQLDRINTMITVPPKVVIRHLLKRRNKTIPILTPSAYLLELSSGYASVSPETRFAVPTVFEILRSIAMPSSIIYNSRFGEMPISAKEIRLDEKNLLTYILISIDEYYHHKGAEHPATITHMRDIDLFLQHLFSRISERFDDFYYIVISDHGFSSVRHRLDMQMVVDGIDPAEFVMFTDATMARFWFTSERARDEVEDRLRALRYGVILDDSLKEQFGIDFSHNYYGDLILLLNPGVVPLWDSWGMCISPTHPLVGAHGYDPRHDSSHGFLSTNIGIRGDMVNIIDVLPSLLRFWDASVPGHLQGRSRL